MGSFPSLARRASREWGTAAAERALPFPCDALAREADAVLFRGVSVNASTATVYRWLCQLRVAPYSYDWIDNWGRRSPQHLSTGLEQLSRGQELMGIFTLVDFETDRHVTLRIRQGSAAERAFGDVRGTYLVVAEGQGCRLLVKLLAQYPPGLVGMAARRLLPWGDLVMMRRQLLNLKRLAERQPPLSGEE
ncbi:MAG: hypothetical protein ABI895_32805 [Deltaproteobacteria bacterium]